MFGFFFLFIKTFFILMAIILCKGTNELWLNNWALLLFLYFLGVQKSAVQLF